MFGQRFECTQFIQMAVVIDAAIILLRSQTQNRCTLRHVNIGEDMKTNKIIQIVCILAIMTPSVVYAYGEGEDINYGSRAMHMLMNDVRVNPHEALQGCPDDMCLEGIDCYPTSSTPVYWRTDLRHAAELQSKLLAEAHSGLYDHCTPCTLVSTIGTDYQLCKLCLRREADLTTESGGELSRW